MKTLKEIKEAVDFYISQHGDSFPIKEIEISLRLGCGCPINGWIVIENKDAPPSPNMPQAGSEASPKRCATCQTDMVWCYDMGIGDTCEKHDREFYRPRTASACG